MPHVTIRHLPRTLSPQQTQQLSEAITNTLLENFPTYEDAVSITLRQVEKPDWKTEVVKGEPGAPDVVVVKEPHYR